MPKTKKTQIKREWGDTWSLKEKKILLDGLKRFPINDVEKIQKLLPKKSVAEVERMIKSLKNSASGSSNKIKAREFRSREAPIESWLDLANELVYYEQEDHSAVLGKAFSIISNFENHPTPGPSQPNYRQIYKYLYSLMKDNPLPKLSPTDSVVVLELLYSLVEVVKKLDSSLHVKLMQWKYQLMNDKVDISDLRKSCQRSKLALTNDFSEIVPIPDSKLRPTAVLEPAKPAPPVAPVAKPSPEKTKLSSSTLVSHFVSTPSGRQEIVYVYPKKPVVNQMTSTDDGKNAAGNSVTSSSTALKTKSKSGKSKRAIPQRAAVPKKMLNSEVTVESVRDKSINAALNYSRSPDNCPAVDLVVPSTSKELPAVTTNSKATRVSTEPPDSFIVVKTVSSAGGVPQVKYIISENKTSALDASELSEATTDILFTVSELAKLKKICGQTESQDTAGTAATDEPNEGLWEAETEEPVKSNRGRKSHQEPLTPLKKPKLFSLNPFCIPTEMIKIKPFKFHQQK